MHTIGLTRAWRLESLDPNALVVVRQFNLPTGLTADQQVWLELSPQPSCRIVRVEFNGKGIPVDCPADESGSLKDGGIRWIVESLLRNNQMRLEVLAANGFSPQQVLEATKKMIDMSLWFQAELQIV